MNDNNNVIAKSTKEIIQETSNEIKPLQESDQILLSKWREKIKKTSPIPIHFENTENGVDIKIQGNRGTNKDQKSLIVASLCQSTGSVDSSFAIKLIEQYGNIASSDGNMEKWVQASNLFIDAINNLNPQDEVEGMLITQILSLQTLGMNFMGRAANPANSTVNIDRNVNNFVKLLRLQHETIESLNRYRRKGAQQVVVQHVNVSQGGQAIVGAVQNSSSGANDKNRGSTP